VGFSSALLGPAEGWEEFFWGPFLCDFFLPPIFWISQDHPGGGVPPTPLGWVPARPLGLQQKPATTLVSSSFSNPPFPDRVRVRSSCMCPPTTPSPTSGTTSAPSSASGPMPTAGRQVCEWTKYSFTLGCYVVKDGYKCFFIYKNAMRIGGGGSFQL